MGPSPWQLLIVLAIVVMLFGTKRLRGMGSDLGEAIRGFKKSVSDDKSDDKIDAEQADSEPKKVQAEDAATADQADSAAKHDKPKTH